MKPMDNYVSCLEDFEQVRLVVNLLYAQDGLNETEYGYGVNLIHDLIEGIYHKANTDFGYDDFYTNLPSYSKMLSFTSNSTT